MKTNLFQSEKDKSGATPASKPVFFQPKLTINRPNDVYEQEADHMADKVMRMNDDSLSQNTFFKPAAGSLQRKCQACEEEDKFVHRKETDESDVQGSNELDNYVGSLSSSGQPMPENSRGFFEPRFGHDFSNVKVHTDAEAVRSAQSINALAYTSGNNIVFNSGQFSPESDSGKKLMAHELTHVVQQGKNVVSRNVIQRTPGVDGRDSYKDIIVLRMDPAVTTDIPGKTARMNEAVNRMLNTSTGLGLMNRLWKIACAKPPCKKINVTFTDDISSCPEGAGCFRPPSIGSFPYTVLVGNVLPRPASNSRTLSSQWGAGDNAVTWHHTDPESAMANTLFHELEHVWFLNFYKDPLMPTGHLDAQKGEIDSRFSGPLQVYNNQLDVNENQIHNQTP